MRRSDASHSDPLFVSFLYPTFSIEIHYCIAGKIYVYPALSEINVRFNGSTGEFIFNGAPNDELVLMLGWPYVFHVDTPGTAFWIVNSNGITLE